MQLWVMVEQESTESTNQAEAIADANKTPESMHGNITQATSVREVSEYSDYIKIENIANALTLIEFGDY